MKINIKILPNEWCDGCIERSHALTVVCSVYVGKFTVIWLCAGVNFLFFIKVFSWVLSVDTRIHIVYVCVLYSVSRKMENWTGWMYYIWWLREDILLCTKIAVQSGYSLLKFSINSIFFWWWPAWSTKMSFVHISSFYRCEVWYRCNSTTLMCNWKMLHQW